MRNVSWRLMLPLLAIVALAATSSTAAATATAAPTSTLDKDQTLNVNLGGEPQSLDPQRATDVTSITVLRQLYSTLLQVDEKQNIVPGLAKEVPTTANGGISADGLTYTYHLRDGLKWSDGTPLTAQAFVDGAKRLFEPGSGNYYVDFYRVLAATGNNLEVEKQLAAGKTDKDIADLEQKVVDNLEVTAPDATTVVYHLNTKSPVFLLLSTLWPLYPIRQDIVTAKGDQWTQAGNLIADGPFMLKDWTHNQSITLVKNPNYYQANDVALQTVNIAMITDDAVAYLAYQKGELDAVTLGPDQLVQVRADAKLQKEFQAYALLSTIGVYFNEDYKPFQDAKVRQALAGAFNREQYAETVREGAVLPAYSWIPPGMPGYDASIGQQYKDAVAKSKQLLSDAGYPDGKGLTVEILQADSSVSKLTGEWLKEQWETNLGITVTLKTLDRATYFSERNAGNFQVTSGGWGADYPDPQNWMPLFKTGGALNSGNFSDASFDKLIDAAATELDNTKRLDDYNQAQKILIDQAPFAPLYFGRRNALIKPYVKGLVTSSMEGDIPGDFFLSKVSIQGKSS
jgi:oligopeptide transport system substrate-binding protein